MTTRYDHCRSFINAYPIHKLFVTNVFFLRYAAVLELPVGYHCDEINERRYCAYGLVCHRCRDTDSRPICARCEYKELVPVSTSERWGPRWLGLEWLTRQLFGKTKRLKVRFPAGYEVYLSKTTHFFHICTGQPHNVVLIASTTM